MINKIIPTILHIASWYPNRMNEHDGNFIQKHIRCIAEDTRSVVLAVYEDPKLLNTSRKFDFERNNTDGVDTWLYFHQPAKWKWLKILTRFYYYWKGFRTIQKEYGRLDLIHAHVFLFAGIFAWLLSIRYNIPYLVTEHSTIYDGGSMNRMVRFLLKKAAAKSQLILPVSKDLAGKMKARNINGKFRIIPNVVDTSLFKPGSKNTVTGKFTFLHISNFSYNKNMPGLLVAFKILSEKRTDFKLILAGDGDPIQLKKLINEINIDPALIDLNGELTEVQVAEKMQSAHAFVLFSRTENLPCVLIEAQACGLPVISTDVGGVSEIIQSEKQGILIEKDNISHLAEALEKMIDQYQLFDQYKIRHKAVRSYSNESIKQIILERYRKVLSKSGLD